MSKRTSFFILLGILALGTFFRFYLIKEVPLGLYPDEAMNGNNALEAIHNTNFSARGGSAFGGKFFYPENNGREGLFINIQALSVWAFGNEPWALRLVSAIFGVLTILGVYLVTKELFRKNFQFSKFAPSANSRALPAESQAVGFQLNFQSNPNDSIFKNYKVVALLSSFFLATSYWHLNFSRIGFRAIAVPFFATFAIYFLLKGLRTGKIYFIVAAGIFTGLGLQTYIAFRFMPFVLAVPILWYLWSWWKEQNEISGSPTSLGSRTSKACAPCVVLLFIFITFIVALPIGWYFFQNPQDFLGRGGQVSIFSAESPLAEFVKSNVATLGMFFIGGDCNWRHNYACKPELHPLVALFFIIGFISVIRGLFNSHLSIINYQSNSNDSIFKRLKIGELKNSLKIENWRIENLTILAWLIFMSFPATLTREGLPHALRAIGMIPPVMIFAGLGAWKTLDFALNWLEKNKINPPTFLQNDQSQNDSGQHLTSAIKPLSTLKGGGVKWPDYTAQLSRIQREIVLFFIFLLLLVPLATYKNYFIRWANNVNAYFAFTTDIFHAGEYLQGLPQETKKYVMVNLSGEEVRGIPMPAQTVMFATDTFREEKRREKNIYYLTSKNWGDVMKINGREKTVIVFLNGNDLELINKIKDKFPQLKSWVPGDFTILKSTNVPD